MPFRASLHLWDWSQWHCWKFKSYGIWHCVIVQLVPSIWKDCTAFAVAKVLKDHMFYFDTPSYMWTCYDFLKGLEIHVSDKAPQPRRCEQSNIIKILPRSWTVSRSIMNDIDTSCMVEVEENTKNSTCMFMVNGLFFCCTWDRFGRNWNKWGDSLLVNLFGLFRRRKDIVRMFLTDGTGAEIQAVCACVCATYLFLFLSKLQ